MRGKTVFKDSSDGSGECRIGTEYQRGQREKAANYSMRGQVRQGRRDTRADFAESRTAREQRHRSPWHGGERPWRPPRGSAARITASRVDRRLRNRRRKHDSTVTLR